MNSSNQHTPNFNTKHIGLNAIPVKGRAPSNTKRLLMRWLAVVAIPIIMAGCEKFVTVDPPTTGLVSETVYTSNATAAAAVTSIFSRLSAGGLATGNNSISLQAGLSADELKNYSINLVQTQFYTNSLTSSNGYHWAEFFQNIYLTNAVLEGLKKSTGVTPDMRQQIEGEAKFMRAFLNFYAVNLYGDFPLVTSTDYRVNNAQERSPIEQVYEHIIADLGDAKELLGDKYLNSLGAATADRGRPNRIAALAMLARVNLYTKKWAQAEASATEIINKTSDFNLLTDLTKVFLAGSKEAIWQLQPVLPGYNTLDAYYFVLTTTPGADRYPVGLSDGLLKTFQPTDARLSKWVSSFKNTSTNVVYYYPYKYKVNTVAASQPVTEAVMVLRLAEQFLIRAEARARQDNLSGAHADLNAVRARASLVPIYPATQAATLDSIGRERQRELFTEWGHRWLDLKRTSAIDAVMDTVTTSKGGKWKTTAQWFPIPLSETLINPKLRQNDGY